METTKIGQRVHQYEAIDDCSRFCILAVCPRRNARNMLLFLALSGRCRFRSNVTRLRGEFSAESVQRRLKSERIKFGPFPPCSRHLNGGVGDSQLTDLNDSWFRHVPSNHKIEPGIEEWQSV